MINIDDILKKRGLNKKDLAAKLEMSRENLHRVLTGNPTLANLERVAQALDVPLWRLFTDSGNTISGFIEFQGEIYRIHSEEDIHELLKKIARPS